jgi:hypothetical protein
LPLERLDHAKDPTVRAPSGTIIVVVVVVVDVVVDSVVPD